MVVEQVASVACGMCARAEKAGEREHGLPVPKAGTGCQQHILELNEPREFMLVNDINVLSCFHQAYNDVSWGAYSKQEGRKVRAAQRSEIDLSVVAGEAG